MKKLIFLTIITGVMFTSCSKKNTPTPQQASNTVSINGSTYPTAVIGTQTWTTLNYNGAGGVNYDNVTGNLTGSGKLYTYAEATGVQLPSGWRLPTQADCSKLLLFIGGSVDNNGNGTASGSIAGKLVDPSWAYVYGDNSTKFDAFPFGFYNSADATFEGSMNGNLDSKNGGGTTFWTSTPVPNNTMIYGFGISDYPEGSTQVLTAYLDYYRPADRCSLRFVKDN